MKLNVIITGATGMVGKGVLLECLEHSDVNSILLLNRRKIGMDHPKLKEIIQEDFTELSNIQSDLGNYNSVFFCMGISSIGMNEDQYSRITYDITLACAHTVLQANPDISFCYVSGQGTDSTEKGRSMWARVKGKTENDLLKLPFRSVFMFRPGIIFPKKGIRSKTRWYNIGFTILLPFTPIFRLFPGSSTDTTRIGQAMINATLTGYDKQILENRDINALAKKFH